MTSTQAREPSIRRAQPKDAATLSDTAFRSKAYWGYDKAFMEACRDDLTVASDALASHPHYLVEVDEQPVSFCNLYETADGVFLQNLFVAPEAIGQGLGKLLWQHMIGEAQARSYTHVLIHSDPYAEPFYTAMGAKRIGLVTSTVFVERQLPLLRFDLEKSACSR